MQKLQKNQFALALVGFTFSWNFFPPNMMASFFPDAQSYSSANELLLALTALLFLAAFLIRRPAAHFIDHHRFGSLCLTLSGIGGYGLMLTGLAEKAPSLLLASTLLLSLSYVALMLCWAVALARLDMHQTMLLLFSSSIGYALLTLGNFLPMTGQRLICGLSTALSGVCWYCLRVNRSKQSPSYSFDLSALAHAPFALLGLLAVLLIGGRMMTGLFFNLSNNISFGELFVRCACIAAVMSFCIASLARGDSVEQGYRNAWIPATGLFLLGNMMAIGLQGPASAIGVSMAHGALNCFEVIFYLVMLQFVKNDRVSPVMVMGLGMILLKVLPIAMQRIVFPQLMMLFGLSSTDVVPAVILMTMVMVVSVLTFANHRATITEPGASSSANESASSGNPTAGRSDFGEACKALADAAGLSARETEIMILLARGNSQKHISEVLFLALGTVQWYAKTIYRKLGVHSKQELINLVNAQETAQRTP